MYIVFIIYEGLFLITSGIQRLRAFGFHFGLTGRFHGRPGSVTIDVTFKRCRNIFHAEWIGRDLLRRSRLGEHRFLPGLVNAEFIADLIDHRFHMIFSGGKRLSNPAPCHLKVTRRDRHPSFKHFGLECIEAGSRARIFKSFRARRIKSVSPDPVYDDKGVLPLAVYFLFILERFSRSPMSYTEIVHDLRIKVEISDSRIS